MNDANREALVARLRPLTQGWPDDVLDTRRPAFLSQSRPGGGVTWYAVTQSPRQAREVREHLLAFIGPSYSDFTGQTAEWDCTDPIEAELASVFPSGFRLSPVAGEAETVSKLFARLRQMLRERPVRDRSEPLPIGRLLRDFELLMRAADWPGVAAVLDRLRDRGQLTADQLAGLHLRLLGGQERWAEVLSSPDLPGLVAGRMPAAVSEAVAVALFHEHLAQFATEAEAAAFYREQISTNYGAIFRQRTLWRHQDALRAAAIADIAARAEPATPPANPYSAAVAAHRAGDSATAFTLLAPGPYTAESLRLLVEAALDLGTLDAARAALDAVQNCEVSNRDQAFSRRAAKTLLIELKELAGAGLAEAPADWLAWLARAAQGSWPDAAEAAGHLGAQWPTPSPSEFNASLAEHLGGAFPAVRDALPSLLNLLLPEGRPDPRFGPSYRLLLEQLVLDDDLSPATAPVVAELAEAVLRAGPVASNVRNDYRDVVECLTVAWERLKRGSLLEWGLGLLDLAAEHAVHRHTDVIRFTQDIVGEFARAPRLVTPSQRAMLRVICAELEVPAAADLLVEPRDAGSPQPADETAILRKRLGRRSVTLLTLSDRIASVFRQMMREKYPDARVDVVQESSGTDRLNASARSADIFIVNTFDAKHSATMAVPRQRSTSGLTLFPKGKNAARQLDALEDWLRSLS